MEPGKTGEVGKTEPERGRGQQRVRPVNLICLCLIMGQNCLCYGEEPNIADLNNPVPAGKLHRDKLSKGCLILCSACLYLVRQERQEIQERQKRQNKREAGEKRHLQLPWLTASE